MDVDRVLILFPCENNFMITLLKTCMNKIVKWLIEKIYVFELVNDVTNQAESCYDFKEYDENIEIFFRLTKTNVKCIFWNMSKAIGLTFG